MGSEQPVVKEVVIKEHPRSTYWLEGKQVRAVGNLILTNERLVFVRQAALSEKQTEELKGLGQGPMLRIPWTRALMIKAMLPIPGKPPLTLL